MSRVAWIAIIAGLALVGSGVWVWANFFDTYHLKTVKPDILYRDGLRSMRTFDTALASHGIKTIICLLDHDERAKEPFVGEEPFLLRAKIRFVPIPVKLGGYPNTHEVQVFLGNTENKKRWPLLVHCAQGVRRTGMMVAAYQMSVMGMTKDQAKAAIETFGHSRRSIGDIEKFIDVYDPVKREVTQDLGVGDE